MPGRPRAYLDDAIKFQGSVQQYAELLDGRIADELGFLDRFVAVPSNNERAFCAFQTH
jgi:hypothetical protein